MDPAEAENAHRPAEDPTLAPFERTYATFNHLTVLACHVFVPVIPALVMWLIKRKESEFIDDHGKEAVNFQISLVVYFLLGLVLTPVLVGFAIFAGVYVLAIVGMILAVIAANNGRYFRYPMCIRFVR